MHTCIRQEHASCHCTRAIKYDWNMTTILKGRVAATYMFNSSVIICMQTGKGAGGGGVVGLSEYPTCLITVKVNGVCLNQD